MMARIPTKRLKVMAPPAYRSLVLEQSPTPERLRNVPPEVQRLAGMFRLESATASNNAAEPERGFAF